MDLTPSLAHPVALPPTPETGPGDGNLPGELALRRMCAKDLPFVLDLHAREFPAGLQARLGRRFVRAYTRAFLTSPYAVVLLAECGGVAVGYLIGVSSPAGHRRFVLRTAAVPLLWWGVLGALRRPGLVAGAVAARLRRRLRRRLRPCRNAAGRPAAPAGSQGAVLAHVAVTGAGRSRGVGTALVTAFVRAARAARCSHATLVTLAGAGGAGAFYERLGWRERCRLSTPRGRELVLYDHDLSGS